METSSTIKPGMTRNHALYLNIRKSELFESKKKIDF